MYEDFTIIIISYNCPKIILKVIDINNLKDMVRRYD